MRAKKRNKAGWLTINFILMAVLGLFVYLNIRIHFEKQALAAKTRVWQRKLEQLKAEEQQLASEISFVKTKRFLEEVARDHFGLERPGENVVAFDKEGKTKTNKEKEQEKKNLLQKILDKVR